MSEPRPLVLIVEDERSIRQFVRAALMRDGLATVFEAETLRQARADARRASTTSSSSIWLPDAMASS